MSDMNREQVIDWCISEKIDFNKPKFPSPEGWLWCDPEKGTTTYSLTAIFTNTVDEDVEWLDIFFIVASKNEEVKKMMPLFNQEE